MIYERYILWIHDKQCNKTCTRFTHVTQHAEYWVFIQEHALCNHTHLTMNIMTIIRLFFTCVLAIFLLIKTTFSRDVFSSFLIFSSIDTREKNGILPFLVVRKIIISFNIVRFRMNIQSEFRVNIQINRIFTWFLLLEYLKEIGSDFDPIENNVSFDVLGGLSYYKEIIDAPRFVFCIILTIHFVLSRRTTRRFTDISRLYEGALSWKTCLRKKDTNKRRSSYGTV